MRARGSTHFTGAQDSSILQARRRQPEDDLVDHYVGWREACRTVAEAYESWRCAECQDQSLAFGVYVSALDREEQAATAYRAAVEQLTAV